MIPTSMQPPKQISFNTWAMARKQSTTHDSSFIKLKAKNLVVPFINTRVQGLNGIATGTGPGQAQPITNVYPANGDGIRRGADIFQMCRVEPTYYMGDYTARAFSERNTAFRVISLIIPSDASLHISARRPRGLLWPQGSRRTDTYQ
jgi:hypothetical protein